MPEWVEKYWIEAFFGIVLALFGVVFGSIQKAVNKKVKKYEYLGEGVKALLYDRLRQAHNYHMKSGYISIDDFKNFYSLYNSYHKLGGNGTGTEMLNRLQSLSDKPPKE